MRFLLTLGFSVLSHPTFAQDALFGLAGNWAGAGTYLDRNIEEDVRCRISVTTTDAKTDVVGICASARRNEDVDFSIMRTSDGRLMSRQENANSLRRPVVLEGVLEDNGLQLSGQQGAEETRLTMHLTEAGKMEMVIVIASAARTRTSTLLFTRRQ
ncbi:hypothetical protein QTO30_10565 [Yoonia sp. GPGPB17]|uniref:hypothetical protein n=1 Tax=Yoonia sp. GPGPB17 TaxID=3026147 RepID=UPI0030C15776